MEIRISNLNPLTNNKDLLELFSKYGNIQHIRIIEDKFTGSSNKIGFVNMDDENQALNAIKNLNNTKFEGNVVNVSSFPLNR